ncbi:MAG: hypothetical protein Kapaf2KO_12690 [Candidatus Kapaibacteriales bacterium]
MDGRLSKRNKNYINIKLESNTSLRSFQQRFPFLYLESLNSILGLDRIDDGFSKTKLDESSEMAQEKKSQRERQGKLLRKRLILRNSFSDIYRAKRVGGKEISEEELSQIINSGMVEYAERPSQISFYDNKQIDEADPLAGLQEHLNIIGYNGTERADLPDASGILIGITDSGFDMDHEDLVDNFYINPDEIAGNGIDDDQNGFVDDVSGWDFVGDIKFEDLEDDIFKPDNDPSADITNEHGTHVAGCASAVNENGIGVLSPGRNAKLLPVKVGADNQSEVYGLYFGYEGIAYASSIGADIVNCSWGGPGNSRFDRDIIKAVDDAGTIVIASAGNSTRNTDFGFSFPNAYPEVISIGASDDDGLPAGFSNFGMDVDVFSPGVNVLATIPGDRYARKSGTSMAGPVAAGMAAVVLAKYPSTTRQELRARMRYSSVTSPTVSEEEDFLQLYADNIHIDSLLAEDQQPTLAIDKTDIGEEIDSGIDLGIIPVFGSVKNVTMKIEPLDGFYEVSPSELIYATVDDIINQDLSIQFSDDNPYYSGYSALSISGKYDSGKSLDSYRFSFALDSMGAIKELQEFGNEIFRVFWSGSAIIDGEYWLTGLEFFEPKGVVLNTTTGEQFDFTEDVTYMTGIQKLSNERLVVGTNRLSQLWISEDRFETYEKKDLSNFLRSIKGIKSYESGQRLVTIGTGSDARLGIVISEDGGETFSLHPYADVNIENEVQNLNIVFLGDTIAFADNAGSIHVSFDRGKNWQGYNTPDGRQYVHRITMDDKGNLAIFGSSSSRLSAIPNLYETSLSSATGSTFVWDSTISNEIPSEIFANQFSSRYPLGMRYISDSESTKLYMTGPEGRVIYKELGTGNPIKYRKAVRYPEVLFTEILTFEDGVSQKGYFSIYQSERATERLLIPLDEDFRSTLEITSSDTDLLSSVNGDNYNVNVSDSTVVGTELLSTVRVELVSIESDAKITLLEQPQNPDIYINLERNGDWLNGGDFFELEIVSLPNIVGTLNDVARIKVGNVIVDINITIISKEPNSIRPLGNVASIEEPYLADGMIILPKGEESSTLSEITGKNVKYFDPGTSQIDISKLENGLYLLQYGKFVYKFSIE